MMLKSCGPVIGKNNKKIVALLFKTINSFWTDFHFNYFQNKLNNCSNQF